MQSEVKLVKTSCVMGHNSGKGRISAHQQAVCAVNQKIPFFRSEESSQFQLKNESQHSLAQPYITPNCQLRQTANSVQPKSSENDLKAWRRETSCNGKELVKHMSNLPNFLQQVEKRKSIQEKALNFGVLDWKHLEKWKYNERMPRNSRTTSGNSSCSAGVKFRSQSASQVSIASSSLYGARLSSSRRQPLPSHMVHLSSSKEVRNACYHNEEKYNERKDSKKEMISQKAVSLPDQGQHELSLSQCIKINAQGEWSDMGFGDGVKTSIETCPTEAQVPKLPKNSYTGPGTSFDEQFSEAAGKKLSDFFSTLYIYSGECCPGVRRSCPLPVAATIHAECTMESHSLATSEAVMLRVHTNTNPAGKGKCSTVKRETDMPSSLIEGSLKTQADVSEQRRAVSSHPRRFSFSLGKMSRSVSSEDASAVQRSSSTYTPVKSSESRPHVSSTTDSTERDEENPTNRRQSSPLRRLLDPLLKYKGAYSAEIVRPDNGNLLSITSRTTRSKEPPHNRNSKASSFQALLQLSLKNGLPFFKLVVDNSEHMLAAAAKRFPTGGKSDPCMIYTFYSVHAIRKKSFSWIGQGSSNGKSCSLGYNIVGQMKISNFNHGGECDEKECVLYGVNPGQIDKPTFGFVPNKEIAAIIMKNSNVDLTCKDQHKASTTTILKAEDNKLSKSIVVLLPGGVHGVPIEGMASSLISRWKSGGLCDCGGWDVGCKLRIFTDHTNNTSLVTPDSDPISLFEQDEEEQGKPAFSLKLLNNGLYSIESSASISLLEAFSICVAYVTCSKLPETVGMKGPSDVEAVRGTEKTKTVTTFHEQFPAKFVACPPPSPTGRI